MSKLSQMNGDNLSWEIDEYDCSIYLHDDAPPEAPERDGMTPAQIAREAQMVAEAEERLKEIRRQKHAEALDKERRQQDKVTAMRKLSEDASSEHQREHPDEAIVLACSESKPTDATRMVRVRISAHTFERVTESVWFWDAKGKSAFRREAGKVKESLLRFVAQEFWNDVAHMRDERGNPVFCDVGPLVPGYVSVERVDKSHPPNLTCENIVAKPTDPKHSHLHSRGKRVVCHDTTADYAETAHLHATDDKDYIDTMNFT